MGGAGGTASRGGAVDLFSGASVYTMGDYSHALFAQSVGGGGGDGGFSIGASFSDSSGAVSASVGGYGGKGGDGGNVTLTSTGTTISTTGDHSDGILAQSIGGGGGEGGFSIVGGIGESTSVNVGVGGTGGTGGAAGTVSVTNSSAIYTTGRSLMVSSPKAWAAAAATAASASPAVSRPRATASVFPSAAAAAWRATAIP